MTAARAGGKGFELEEVLRAYFRQAGYFVVRGLPFRLDGDDVTDVDLWLYERPAASTRRRLIVDIKNRKSPKAAERLIWAKGLQTALAVDGAVVATTDTRPSTRRLARSLNVILLDGEALGKLNRSESLRDSDHLTSQEFEANLKMVDEARRSSEWRQRMSEMRGALISDFGVQSVNKCLAASRFFSEQAVHAHSNSTAAEMAVRVFYLSVSLFAISIDYVLSDQIFRSPEDKRQAVINSVRFGNTEGIASVGPVRAAIGLARKYAEHGGAVAKQIEYGFYADAEKIPAEIIADFVARHSSSDFLFTLARELERAAFRRSLLSFDDFSIEVKSLLGVSLDFSGVSREKFARAWTGRKSTRDAPSTPNNNEDGLFPALGKSGGKPKPKTGND